MKKFISILLSVVLALLVLPAYASESDYIDRSGWKYETASFCTWATVEKAFDGNAETYWGSDYKAEGSEITQKDPLPIHIDITLPNVTEVFGFAYLPRPNSNSGKVLGYNIYYSKDASNNFELIKGGNFDATETVKEVGFDSSVKAKKIRFEVTKGANDLAIISEFNLLSRLPEANEQPEKEQEKESEKADEPQNTEGEGKNGWKISATSAVNWAPVERAIDGNTDTFWHSGYKAEGSTITEKDPLPIFVDITLPELTEISGITYTPRKASSNSGIIMKYRLYAAADDTAEPKVIKEGELEGDSSVKNIEFTANVCVKKLRLEIVDGFNALAVIAEIDLIEKSAGKETVAIEDFATHEDENAERVLDRKSFTATVTSTWGGGTNGQTMLDGASQTMWHSDPTQKLNQGAQCIDIDFHGTYEITGFGYYPRQSADNNGHWKKYNVYTSNDGEIYEQVLADAVFNSNEINNEEKKIYFDEPVTARYIEFEIVDGVGLYASCAELNFYQSKDGASANGEKYVLKIDSQDIAVGNEKTVTLDVAPFIENGSTMIPLRGLLEEMGASITWDGDSQSITTDKAGIIIKMQIEHELVWVGNIRYTLRVAPMIKNSRTFIPLRFVSEQLGYNVEWNATDRTITITK